MRGRKMNLEKLQEKQKALASKIENMKKQREEDGRKYDSRRARLIGDFYLEKALKDGSMAQLAKEMDGFLRKNSDRVLFGLAPKKRKATNPDG